MKIIPIKRALISVSDKSNIEKFAQELIDLGVEIISTGGTSKVLHDAKIPHRLVDDLTQLPEMLNGRVKTLHPKIHGGILGKRDLHAEEVQKHDIQWIDLVAVNFYPFSQSVKSDMSWDQVVEYIDIGGPTMLRAAAKNFAWVGAVIDPNDYADVIAELKEKSGLSLEKRQYLAGKVFEATSRYDQMIHQHFISHETKQTAESELNLALQKSVNLRYGENPHQAATAYQFKHGEAGILNAKQHQGKELSYNNILDAEAALICVKEFHEPACVIVKHANPCGAASAATIEAAYHQAYASDSLSAFGGIIALNRACDKEIAEAVAAIFMEVIIAPSYTEEALAIFAKKPNLRVLEMPTTLSDKTWEMRFISGGLLMQERDTQRLAANDLVIVTEKKPEAEEIDEMLFAWKVLKHIKSNGILIAKNKATLGIGAGQVSRIDAVEAAIRKAGESVKDSILASDAFFPFRDSIDRIAQTGVRAIIQPGGSVRDEEVIAACNEHGIAMVFTGKRCFKH